MGALDILKAGYEMISGSGKSSGATGGGAFDSLMGLIGGKSPELASKAKDAKESAEQDRASIFGELGKSLLLRQFPRISAMIDIGKQVTGNKDAEVVPWQHEFETISALLIIVPNKWKHYITDMFANSSIFQALIKYWPGLDGVDIPIFGSTGLMSKDAPIMGKGGSLRERILNEKDPDAVIEAIRIMHQDIFVTGKISFDSIKEKLGLGGALATAGAGVAALTAGSALLGGGDKLGNGGTSGGGGSSASYESGPGLKGQKITEVIKAHPEIPQTTMQKNLIAVLQKMNVLDSAELVRGKWEGNNDEVTVGIVYDNARYFLTFDDDITKTVLTLNTSDGRQIARFRDWGSIDAESDAKDLISAMRSSPAPKLTSAQPATSPAPGGTSPAKAADAPLIEPPKTF